jgi:hypothetical protein
MAMSLMLFAGAASATPRYALVAGQNCSLCHQNPSGGGLRSGYATQYLIPERLAMRTGSDEGAILPDPQIGQDIVVGADARTFGLWQEDADSGNNFVQMSGAVYGAIQLRERYALYLHTEWGQGAASAPEIWGIGWFLPGAGYVKAGRFVPAFGWRVPDHRSFTRRDFVFLPPFPPHSDTGLEIGFHPGRFQLQASVTNGEFRSPRDGDQDLAVTARGAWLFSVSGVNAQIGGSWFSNDGTQEKRLAGGGFAGASWRALTWLGELDWSRAEPRNGDPTRNRSTLSQELSIAVVQGFWVVGTYDFHDPDVDRQTGAVHRAGAGLDALVSPFLQLRGKVNAFLVDEGADATRLGYTSDFVQAELEIHFLY